MIGERAMPRPNCTEAADVGVIDFGRLGRRVIEGRFDGGSMTSDGGVMLLSAVDRKLGLIEAASRCIADPRNPLLISKRSGNPSFAKPTKLRTLSP